jgi:hypothetical protein
MRQLCRAGLRLGEVTDLQILWIAKRNFVLFLFGLVVSDCIVLIYWRISRKNRVLICFKTRLLAANFVQKLPVCVPFAVPAGLCAILWRWLPAYRRLYFYCDERGEIICKSKKYFFFLESITYLVSQARWA